MVGAGRIELPTSWSQTRRAPAAPRPEGMVERPRGDSNARTRLRRPVLYPLSYGGHQSTIPAPLPPNKPRPLTPVSPAKAGAQPPLAPLPRPIALS